MTALFPDTHPKVEALQLQIVRQMPTWKKIALVDSLNEAVRALAISGIKERYPNAGPEEVRRLLAELMYGAELAHKVYGHAR
ncbi:MAG: hypothetical protein KatS3mg050_3609 [Litorilinea sp.]|nr:MAG: hypothetical protein KatS3mg050_3609 [Litorilinea sp.]